MSEWISVEDRLPEQNQWVIISDNCGVAVGVGCGVLITGGWLAGGKWPIDNVTHWMPLPEPPEQL